MKILKHPLFWVNSGNLMDAVSTFIGVSSLGIGWEANDLLKFGFHHIGIIATLFIKLLIIYFVSSWFYNRYKKTNYKYALYFMAFMFWFVFVFNLFFIF